MVIVGILVFDDVEELDFVGPLEVFGMAGREGADCRVVLVAESLRRTTCRYGLKIEPDVAMAGCPELGVLIVPGGHGARAARVNASILGFVSAQRGIVASVCTGALILAAAGVLDGRRATTHHGAMDLLREYPKVIVDDASRVILEDRIGTSAGVSAGIDLALAITAKLWGAELAIRVARQIEWPSGASA